MLKQQAFACFRVEQEGFAPLVLSWVSPEALAHWA